MFKIQNSTVKIHDSFKVNNSNGSSPVVGKYFYTTTVGVTGWETLSNWWGNAGHTTQATTLPLSSTDVIVVNGSLVPLVDLDSPNWVQPNSINSGSVGISFTSNLSGSVTCNITGAANFYGNSTYNY